VRPRRLALVLGFALGCSHSEPFSTLPPDPLGPTGTTLPRRLTFNARSDITPSVAGDTLVYSRVDADRADGDRCLALLPIEGGTLVAARCARGNLADSVRDSWLYPAISPDRQRVAFARERLQYRAGSLLERTLVVAPIGAPDSAVVVVDGYALPDGGFASGYRDVTWRDDTTLRFLGGIESAGGGAVGGFSGRGVFEVALVGDPAGVPVLVPGTAGAIDYGIGEDGAVYILPGGSAAVFRLVDGSAPEEIARFTGVAETPLVGLTGMAVSDGVVAVIGDLFYPEVGTVPQLLVIDVANGGPQTAIPLLFTPQRLAGVPGGGRIVVESNGDLWLVAVR